MEGTPSDLARIVSGVVVVLHEEFDAPVARLLSDLGL
jgi:hypothetical protein